MHVARPAGILLLAAANSIATTVKTQLLTLMAETTADLQLLLRQATEV